MRQDQIERLAKLSEKLADVVLDEADPETWPGHGMTAGEMTQQQRGDRYWAKKNAAATFALLARAESMLADAKQLDPNGNLHERPELDQEIARAEKEAARALDKARERASGIVKRTRANG